MRTHPELESAAIYRGRRGAATASAGRPAALAGERQAALTAMRSGKPARAHEPGAEVLVTPLPRWRSAGCGLRHASGPAPARRAQRPAAADLLGSCCGALALVIVLLSAASSARSTGCAPREAVGDGDLSTRLSWRRRDELGQLAGEFDTMAADLEQHQRGLEELAHRDPLTELANHRRFQEVLGEELDRRARERPAASPSCCSTSTTSSASTTPRASLRRRAARRGRRRPARGHARRRRRGRPRRRRRVRASCCRTPTAARPSRSPRRPARRWSCALPFGARCAARPALACYPDDARSAGALLQLAGGALDLGEGQRDAGARAATTPSTSSWSPRSSARTSRR